jgi:hypothetical protein
MRGQTASQRLERVDALVHGHRLDRFEASVRFERQLDGHAP